MNKKTEEVTKRITIPLKKCAGITAECIAFALITLICNFLILITVVMTIEYCRGENIGGIFRLVLIGFTVIISFLQTVKYILFNITDHCYRDFLLDCIKDRQKDLYNTLKGINDAPGK